VALAPVVAEGRPYLLARGDGCLAWQATALALVATGTAQSTQGARGDGHGVASAGEASIQASKRAAAQKKLRDVICNKIFFTFFFNVLQIEISSNFITIVSVIYKTEN